MAAWLRSSNVEYKYSSIDVYNATTRKAYNYVNERV